MHLHYVDSLSGLSVDSSQFRQRAPHVQLSDNPDTATIQTVQEMCRQIHQAAKDPLVRDCAERAVRAFGRANFGPADACWFWCKHNLRFKHHGSMFEAWSSDLGSPENKLQLLISPDVLVRMNRMEGDCAIYTMMICAMLETLGFPWQIVTAAVDARQPEIFSHVWARSGNQSLDASHGKYPGWQVPSYDLHRVWVFDSNGVRVGDGTGFHGLHAYRRRSKGLRGVDPETGETYSDPIDPYNPPLDTGGTSYEWPDSGSSITPTVTAPSKNDAAAWNLFANSLKGVMTLAQINAIQPGTVVSANGAILRQNPGYAVGTPITGSLNLGGISTTTLMVGGLLLIGAMFMFSKK